MNSYVVNRLLEFGIVLSGQNNPDVLFKTLVETAMDIIKCDCGTLYTIEGELLVFKMMIVNSRGIKKGGEYGEIRLPAIELLGKNICARAAFEGKAYRIEDVYDSKDFDFSGLKKYDDWTRYKTQSMLVVPMENDKGKIIGVVQFRNALNDKGEITGFTEENEKIIKALASQAAICLTNHNYAVELRKTLDSMVEVMTTSIDARTPYNANHTKNMARYAKNFLNWMNKTGKGFSMDEKESHRFIMAVLLHDVGKLITPLEVMNKSTRLDWREIRIRERFDYIGLLLKISLLEKKITKEKYSEEYNRLRETAELIDRINGIGYLDDNLLRKLEDCRNFCYEDAYGEKPWLTSEEYDMLSIRRGTLTADERKIMEEHVIMTKRILSEMHFPEEDRIILTWAADHHEFLNGTGYPKGKKGDELSKEVRLLTILDIFDALTARDRPYKQPTSIEKAFQILENMAYGEGKLDGEIIALFKESKAWEI